MALSGFPFFLVTSFIPYSSFFAISLVIHLSKPVEGDQDAVLILLVLTASPAPIQQGHMHPHNSYRKNMGKTLLKRYQWSASGTCSWWQETVPQPVTVDLVIVPLPHFPDGSACHFSNEFIWALADNNLEVKQTCKISDSWSCDQRCMNPSAGNIEATKHCHHLEENVSPHLCCTWVPFFNLLIKKTPQRTDWHTDPPA